MNRGHRVLALSVLALAAVSACRKKPETTSTPVTPTPEPTCDQRCRDSISMAEKRRADSVAAAAAAAEAAARERALASTRATLAAAVYFEYDSDELSGDARSTLDAKLPILRANAGLRLRIAGNTDERGSDEYNLALGQRRAASVKRYLSDQGIDSGRMDIISYGEERPVVTESSEEGWRMNRRAEFEITAGGDALVAPR
ncbi:MAG: OmpA family protein [Gemmatimonadaceae bacterium]|nr:OmpA family protein [Gemmatimonadaceae bacterium]